MMPSLSQPKEKRPSQGWWSGLINGEEEIEQAYRLVYREYLEAGYLPSHPQEDYQFYLSPLGTSPLLRVFACKIEDSLAGTISLIFDSPLGLPMEEIYSAEIRSLRQQGKSLAEVTRLAINKDWHYLNGRILMELYRLVFEYCLNQSTIDTLCIAIHPKHEEFYQRVLLFEHLGGLKTYPRVNDAPAVAKFMDLSQAEARFRARYGVRHRIYRFFFQRR